MPKHPETAKMKLHFFNRETIRELLSIYLETPRVLFCTLGSLSVIGLLLQ
jgi:hypothetical protein